MLNKLRMGYIKWRYHRIYTHFCNIANEYDCGIQIAESISPRLQDIRRKLDYWQDKCDTLMKKMGDWPE